MRFFLIPLDSAIPALQTHLNGRDEMRLDAAERAVTADLLERCVRTGELLVTYASLIAGRPCKN